MKYSLFTLCMLPILVCGQDAFLAALHSVGFEGGPDGIPW